MKSHLKTLIFSFLISISTVSFAFSQDSNAQADSISTTSEQKTLSTDSTMLTKSAIDSASSDTVAKKKEKKVPFVAMPIVTYDRSQGLGVGAMAMAIFKADTTKNNPLSRVLAVGNYSTNGSFYGIIGTRIYLNEDKWRIVSATGYIDYRFQAYQEFAEFNPGGGGGWAAGTYETPYTTTGAMFVAQLQRQIFKDFHLGLGMFIMRSDLVYDLPDGSLSEEDPNDINSLSIVYNYDTRDNVYNPQNGLFIDGRISFVPDNREGGNEHEFQKLVLFANHYKQIDNTKILASRFAMKANFGDVPFPSQDYIGQVDLRGYTQGEYRGNQTYAIQTEFRHNFYKKWGYVAFAGLGIAKRESEEGASSGDWYNSGESWSKILPSIGAGLRYRVIEKEGSKINAGIDIAKGRDDWGFYFRVIEAF